MIDLSIIVPVHNAEAYLDECLCSLTQSNLASMEIIIVNDGSTDSSLSICLDWELKDRRIRVINSEGQGVSHARNLALNQAQGRWVTFVDADDYVHSNYVEEIQSATSKDTDLVLFSYDEKKNGKTKSFSYQNNYLFVDRKRVNELLFLSDKVQGYVWNKAFRLDRIKKMDLLFDEELSINEDIAFCFEYILHTSKWLYLDESLYSYVKHENSAVNSKLTDESLLFEKSFNKMFQLIDVSSTLEETYLHVAYMYMQSFLLRNTIKNGYLHLESVEKLRRHMLQEGFAFFFRYNLEVRCVVILLHLVPSRLFKAFFERIPDGVLHIFS